MFDLLGGGLGCINGTTFQAPLMMQSSLSPLVFGTNRESGPEACRSAFCIFRRTSGVAWEGELTSRGTSCCVLRKALSLNKLFELVGHGVDVGVRDNEGRQEAQRMGAGVVEHQALQRVEGG